MYLKHKNGWVTFKYCINYQSIIKGWEVENRGNYANIQMNNAVKNQIYSNKSHYDKCDSPQLTRLVSPLSQDMRN